VTLPGTRSPIARGLQLAAVAVAVTLVLVGIPALAGSRTTHSSSGGVVGALGTVPPATLTEATPDTVPPDYERDQLTSAEESTVTTTASIIAGTRLTHPYLLDAQDGPWRGPTPEPTAAPPL